MRQDRKQKPQSDEPEIEVSDLLDQPATGPPHKQQTTVADQALAAV